MYISKTVETIEETVEACQLVTLLHILLRLMPNSPMVGNPTKQERLSMQPIIVHIFLASYPCSNTCTIMECN